MTKFDQKKFEMGEIFKIQEYERVEKKEDGLMMARNEKKKLKIEKFDDGVKDIEDGNWRVLSELEFYPY